jgi:hypothetical protein
MPGAAAEETPAGAAAAGAEGRMPAMSASTAEKNWPAIFFVTPASMRWPTPPMTPPTDASAS